MWLWRWWRWWIGEVTFEAHGGLCEEFLNRLTEEQHVPLWDVQMAGDTLTARCRAADYRAVRRPARRTGTRVRAVEKRGAPFRFRRFRRRPGLPIGAAVGMAVYMILASYVWVIDVQVDDPLLAARVREELAACGLSSGMASDDVDLAAVRMRVIAHSEELHRVSVYLKGSTAHVEVRLQETSQPIPDNSPANVVAAFDGRVVSMQVASGQAMVKAGDAVVQGDLLVCGAIETNGGVLLKRASAVVTAETTHELSVAVSLTEQLPCVGHTVSQPSLHVLWWEIPLYSPVTVSEAYTATEYEYPVTWGDTALPFGIRETVYTAGSTREVTYTPAQAETIAKRRLQAAALTALADAEIRDVSYEGVWEGDTYRLRGVYACTQDIAVQTPLLSDFE